MLSIRCSLFMLHSSIQRSVWSPGTRVVGKYDFKGETADVSYLGFYENRLVFEGVVML